MNTLGYTTATESLLKRHYPQFCRLLAKDAYDKWNWETGTEEDKERYEAWSAIADEVKDKEIRSTYDTVRKLYILTWHKQGLIYNSVWLTQQEATTLIEIFRTNPDVDLS